MNFSCVTRFFGRTYVKAKPHLPTAYVVIGIGLMTWGTIDACIKTAKDTEPVLDNHQAMIDQIVEKERAEQKRKELYPDGVPTYTNEQKTQDTIAAYSVTSRSMVKVYSGPAIKFVLGIAGVALGFGMQHAMYVGAVAVGKKVSDDFAAYRGRVRAKEGTEADLRYLHGTTTETVVETVTDPETGEEKTVVTEVEKYDTSNLPLYSAVFDETNPNFDMRNPKGNIIFINSQMNELTNDLITYGYLTYNRARVLCGFDPVLEGNRVGWIYDEKNPAGDNRVVITMLDDDARNGRYMSNRMASPTLVTFNCDGDIEELMKERGRWPSLFQKGS